MGFFSKKEAEQEVTQAPVQFSSRVAAVTSSQVAVQNSEPSSGREIQPVKKSGVNALITNMASVPSFGKLLSGSFAGAMVQVPAAMENDVCVIERAVGKASILFNHEKQEALSRQIRSIQAQLAANKYQIIGNPGLACLSDIIPQLVENDRLQNSREEKSSIKQTASKPKSLFESWIACAVAEGATDLHIQQVGNQAEVKLRIDGELEQLRDSSGGVYPAGLAGQAVAWAYNNASGKGSNSESQFSDKENLYCMIEPRDIAGKRVALRYQSMRGHAGVKVTCRVLYVDVDQPTLTYEELGYAPSQQKILLDAAATPSGMIFFAGVTGSGKTTTLKTFVETHPQNGKDAFYSIEDPVEYPLRNVHQIPIQRDLLDREGSARIYSETISGLMRSDPSCILLGEIRDHASAISAQQIVETGHMACGTVHAHLISGIIPRLTNSEVGMSRDVLTNPNIITLLGYQALVPRLCPKCRQTGESFDMSEEGADHVKDICDISENRFGLGRESLFFKKQGGCSYCKGRGTKGLTVVAELLSPDRKWLNHIRKGEDYEALMHYRSESDRDFRSPNMNGKTVFEHCLYKSINGIVDLRQCERFDSFKRFQILD